MKDLLDQAMLCNCPHSEMTVRLIQALAEHKVKDWSDEWDDGHYVIAVGYNPHYRIIRYQDPGMGKRQSISYEKLHKRWHDKDNNKIYDHLGIIFKGIKSER